MKKLYGVIYIVFIAELLAYSQSKTTDAYIFSIQPQTEKWNSFKTIEERIAALQIPADILSEISTEGLLETCLYYPYLLNMFCYDNYQLGLEGITNEFNGFRELFTRNNLTDVLLGKYQMMLEDIKNIHLLGLAEQGMFSYRYFVVEFMLSQDIVFNNMIGEQEKKLFSILPEHRKMKQEYANIFSNRNHIPAYLLYAKKTASDPDFVFEGFEQKEIPINFIQSTSITPCETSGMYIPATNIITPNNSIVADCWEFTRGEVTPSAADSASWREFLYNTYNGAILVDMPSHKYNCHAYAWHIVEGGNKIWMGCGADIFLNGNVNPSCTYWMDGSYEEIGSQSATKVSYHRLGNHSAIILDENWYISKWGAGPLAKHHPNDVPPQFQPSLPKKFYRLVADPPCSSIDSITNKTMTSGKYKFMPPCSIYIENVVVGNSSKLILVSGYETTIEKDFEVKLGADVEIQMD